ncbi:MAG: hypothetical protein ABSA70_08070, partial [Terriglobia bacterium]
MLPARVLYYGTEEALPERVKLRAGPLSLVYEKGDLRYIRLGEREILRRVYVAIRDRNWGTIPPRFSSVRRDVAQDSFRISYDVENRQGGVDFFWKGTITGDAQGTVTIAMEGTARSTFLRNRIGFCVLHPIRECAGQACTVEKVDGSIVQGTFPLYTSPDQAFLDIRAISHEVVPGVRAEVRFAGDVFELEDQRNWGDASYKTYSTPLRLPFPVEIKAGTRISQSVTLSLKGEIPPPQAEIPRATLTFTVGRMPPSPLPRIGLGVASHNQALSWKALARLRALNLSHLRVDLRLSQPDFQTILGRASAEASELRVPLELALHLSDAAEEELKRLRSGLEQVKPAVSAWFIFHVSEKSTTEKWAELARRFLADYDPQAKIGAGTNAYFAELNRGRPPVNVADLVS